MLFFVQLLLLATSASAFLFPRGYNSLRANFTQLSADADNITATVNALPPNSPRNSSQSNAVEGAYSTFANDVRQTVANCNSTKMLTAAHAQVLFSNVATSLIPKLKAAANAIIAKKSTWKSQDTVGLNRLVLRIGLISAKDLGSCLVNKTKSDPASIQASASALSVSLTSVLRSARSAYASAT